MLEYIDDNIINVIINPLMITLKDKYRELNTIYFD